ncbi:MAG: T9SS type A sorting domain-containing protein [Ignavibacteriales bacterium]|nr:T9SS type A sorting domain-containing protein [Ignavibacteriales bacterium]
MIACRISRPKFPSAFLVLVSLLSFIPHISDAQVSLRRKIGQMVMVTFVGDSLEKSSASLDTMKSDLANGFVGGTIFFTWSNNLRRPQQITHLTSELQRRSSIPLLIATDEEGGQVARLSSSNGFANTPSAYQMGTVTNSEAYTRSTASMMAGWFQQTGINVDLAPVVDVNVNPTSPAIGALGRSFSSDPFLVASHAGWFIDEFRKKSLFTTLKHFPGHGSAKTDSHLGLVDITKTWADSELTPYRRLLSAGVVDLIMTAHVFNANLDSVYPATLSKKIVTGLLRQNLGYQGVVVSDEMSMQAIVNYYGFDEAITLAVKAGVDILLYNKNQDSSGFSLARHVVDFLEQKVLDGTIAASRIDESYNRIMALKQRIVSDVPAISIASVPANFDLGNYPNPFNSSTAISYRLPALSGVEGAANRYVTLKLYDVLGREVATLVDKLESPGTHIVRWDASRFSSGVYFYRLSADAIVQTRKMVLTK